MALKKTLLAIVQEILNDMDSEAVNSISDTEEATQVASIVESVFYDIVSTRNVPEHSELIKLTALSDSAYPTHFLYPDNLRTITRLDYDVSDDDTFEYREIKWVAPQDFVNLIDGRSSDYDSVYDKQAGTHLRIQNNQHPTYYTSFDDEYVVMDSYKSTIDTTLTTAKTRAFGYVYPVFSQTDSYVPDIDEDMFRYFINEAKSTAQSLLKGGSDPKVEQAARRQKTWKQNDRYNTKRGNNRNDYGRGRVGR